jgi:hypothetical protein
MREQITIRFDPAGGPPRRLRLTPNETDPEHEWWLRTETWTGCSWRTEGRELVDGLYVAPPTERTAETIR